MVRLDREGARDGRWLVIGAGAGKSASAVRPPPLFLGYLGWRVLLWDAYIPST